MKNPSESSRNFVRRWRPQLMIAAGVLAVLALYLFQLDSVPRQVSPNELSVYQQNSQVSHFTDRPLSMGYKFVDFALLHIWPNSIFVARLTSALTATLAVMLFFAILYRWHGKRTALLGTALFAPSGWVLHVGRLGTPQVLWVLVPLVLILLGSWLHGTIKHKLALFICVIAMGWLLFVSGGVWFALAFVVLLRRKLREHLANCKSGARISASALALLFIAALALALYRHQQSIHSWLGVPQQLPQVFVALRQWGASVTYLFIRGPYAPQLWLAHTPILDVFTGAICLLGIYFYATHYRNIRTQTLAVFAALGSVFVALNGAAAMSLLVPLAYLVAATGVAYLLREWLRVFPRNPVARTIGVGLLALAIACAVGYHIAAYFVAWNNNPITVSTFNQNLVQ